MMPGPFPFYRSDAERQRAYRRRKRETDHEERKEAQDTLVYAHVVHRAVGLARKAEDPVARKVYREDAWETLRALADHFYDRAETPPEQRPWRR
jgi:hypothetical protein